ncbi:hypothetical protein HMI51_08800 [Corallococcus coralloides]|nr:hypothetical protein [Corallococcus coralloides]
MRIASCVARFLVVLPLLGCPERTPKEAHAMKPKDESCRPPKTASAFVEQAREELGPGMAGAQFAPVLPTHWPPKGGGLEYFVYRSEPLPTGIVKSEIRGPTERIHFATPGAKPLVESLGNAAVLGVEETAMRESLNPPQNHVERAEQALLDVVAGCRSLDEARGDLEGYLEWVEQNPLQGRDLARRGDTLFSWLRRR